MVTHTHFQIRKSTFAIACGAGVLLVSSCGPKFVQLGENRPAYTREGRRNLGARMVTDNEVDVSALKSVADSYLGVPYLWGGNSMSGIDCSAFTQSVWRRTFGVDLPRVAKQQSSLGIPIFKFGLRAGDLVFFGETSDSASIDHVGIFMGNGKFINATTSGGVRYCSLDDSYWFGKYQFAKRFPNLKLMLDSARKAGVSGAASGDAGYLPGANPRDMQPSGDGGYPSDVNPRGGSNQAPTNPKGNIGSGTNTRGGSTTSPRTNSTSTNPRQ